MTITLSKPIAIIILICLAIIIICDIVIWIFKMYQKRLDKIESKYEIVIGQYDENYNRKNRTFLVGKGDTKSKATPKGANRWSELVDKLKAERIVE